MARYIKDCDCAKVISEKFNILLGDVIDIVYDIPTADVVEVPKWIDIKERLPKDNEKVLCLCQSDIYEVLTWDNLQMGWVHDSNHIYLKTFVRYWQPLPEYPSGEKMDGGEG